MNAAKKKAPRAPRAPARRSTRPPADPAAARVAELRAKAESAPHTMTGAEKRELAAANALDQAAGLELLGAVSEDGAEVIPLHERDPRTLTGQQKMMLAGNPRYSKPVPRGARTSDGVDPRTLTGAQKKMLGAKRRTTAANRPVAPEAIVGALSTEERQELSMLRAGQGNITGIPDLASFEGAELSALERFELVKRRKWKRPA